MTIFPLYDVVASIVPEKRFQIVLILPPGVSPHIFEPAPRDVKNLSGSQVLFLIGHKLDDWVLKIATSAGVKNIITVDKNIKLKKFRGSADFDPHYWLAPKNMILIASQIKDELSRLYPEEAAEFQNNFETYKAGLLQLDSDIRTELKKIKNKKVALFHDFLEYFADEYGLKVAAVFEEHPGKEAGPRQLWQIYKSIKNSGARAVFGEPQFSLEMLWPIVRDLKVRLSSLDPLGGGEGHESYLAFMSCNLNQIIQALK